MSSSEVAPCLQQQLRQTDTVARLGGGEFALLRPETDASATQQITPKMQKQPLSIAFMQKNTDELM